LRRRNWLRQIGTSHSVSTAAGPQRWTAAVAALIELQDEYRAWLDHLPPSLDGSRLAQKLQAIAELDLDERQASDPPRGYGRD
jgi:hypothetical protein